MGNYNSEYESYYAKIMGRKRGQDNLRRDYSTGISGTSPSRGMNPSRSMSDIITKRVIQELAGTFILCILVLMFKVVKTPETTAVYAMAKNIVSEGYDITETIDYAKNVNISSIKYKAEEYVENIKEKFGAGQTIKEKTKENFSKPILGEYTVSDDKQKIYRVAVSEATDISAVYDGDVKKVDEDEILGKYVVIDNGNGIETVYGGLDELLLTEEQVVTKGEMIGKVNAALLFQLKYMGEGRNIEDYMNMD